MSAHTTRWILTGFTLCMLASACGPEENPFETPVRTMTTCGAATEAECAPEAAEWPEWELEDIQPQSERFGQTYGLDAFQGKPVFVAFLVGWCGYCRSQALELEKLRTDPMFSDVTFVVVHGASANTAEDKKAILETEDGQPRHGMIVFQDTEAINAWGQHGGAKDDFYIYAADGSLSSYLEGGQQTNLTTPEGLAFVREALSASMK